MFETGGKNEAQKARNAVPEALFHADNLVQREDPTLVRTSLSAEDKSNDYCTMKPGGYITKQGRRKESGNTIQARQTRKR